jgi:membrane protein YqaA with SNARE-associated domain
MTFAEWTLSVALGSAIGSVFGWILTEAYKKWRAK